MKTTTTKKRGVIHKRHFAELYPLYPSGHPIFIRPDGSLSRFRVTYWSKAKMLQAVKAFRKSENKGLLMDHMLFIDTTIKED